MPVSTPKLSKYGIPLWEYGEDGAKSTNGKRLPLDRSYVYGMLWDLTDSRGVLTVTQNDFGSRIGFDRKKIHDLFAEMQEFGLIRISRQRARGVIVEALVDPNIVDWVDYHNKSHQWRLERAAELKEKRNARET